MGTNRMTYRTPTPGKFWAQSPDHQLAYAAHGVKAFMGKRAANPIVRPAQYAIMRAMQDPIESFDWGTWYTKNFYGRGKAATAKYATGYNVHMGAYIALVPRDPRPLELPLTGLTPLGIEPADNLHCTLAYLGAAADLTQEQQAAVLRICRDWWTAPVTADGVGVTTFAAQKNGTNPLVMLLESAALMARRAALVEALVAAGVPVDMTYPDYKPHVTLAYVPCGSITGDLGWQVPGVVLDRLVVSFGGVVWEYFAKGDVEGHEFHGNQWTEGSGSFEVYKRAVLKAYDYTPAQLESIDPVIELYAKRSKGKIDAAVKSLHQKAMSHVLATLNLPHAPEDLEAGVTATFDKFSWKIPENSATTLRQKLLDTLEENSDGSPADFSKAMRTEWADFAKDQADTIAWTEYNTVATQATLAAYQANGVDYKAWMTVGDNAVCEECQANEDQGPIAIDENFDSGDDGPPAHPDCRCNVTSVVNPEDALPSDYSDLPELQVAKGDLPGHEFHGNQWTVEGSVAGGTRVEAALKQMYGAPYSVSDAAATPYFRGLISHSGKIYGPLGEHPHGEVHEALERSTKISPEKMGLQSITNTGELGSGKDEMMLAVGGHITTGQLSTIRGLFAENHQMPYDLYDHGWVESRTGQGATQFNAHLKELGFVEKSAWSRFVELAKDTLTTGDLRPGGLLAPQQAPKKPKLYDGKAAPAPEHRIDDTYWELGLDPISGEYRVRKGDAPGHEFHGNQWTGSYTGPATLKDTVQRAMGHAMSDPRVASVLGSRPVEITNLKGRYAVNKAKLYIDRGTLEKHGVGFAAAAIHHEAMHSVLTKQGVPSPQQEGRVRMITGQWAARQYAVTGDPGFRMAAIEHGQQVRKTGTPS